MIIFDSSVWIALFNTNDSQHQQANAVFADNHKKIVIHEYLVGEICTVLTQKTDKHIADSFLEYIANNQDVDLMYSSSDFFNSIIDRFKSSNNKYLSFIDTALLHLSRQYEVATFDQELKNAIEKS